MQNINKGEYMYLSDLSKDRNNNLDSIRFIAAILVIICHSFPLCYGPHSSDFLSVYTNGRLSLGGIAVGIFFLCGGFLISRSMQRKKTAKSFFGARCSRIFPPLILVIFFFTFVIGPLITSINTIEYFKNINTYKYLLNSILIPIHNLPGVFENNIYANVVNGALWTLPVEFFCYVLIYLAYKLKLMEKKNYVYTIPLAICIFIVLLVLNNNYLISIIRPILLYYVGMGLNVFSDKIKLTIQNFTISFLLFIISIALRLDIYAMIFLFPYVAFYLAFGIKKEKKILTKKVDISYEMYLCAWPIAQILCMFSGQKMDWYLNSILTIIFSCILGWIIHMTIEKNRGKKR